MSKNVKDVVLRTLYTFISAAVGVLVVAGATGLNVPTLKAAAVAGVAAVVTALRASAANSYAKYKALLADSAELKRLQADASKVATPAQQAEIVHAVEVAAAPVVASAEKAAAPIVASVTGGALTPQQVIDSVVPGQTPPA